jgi:hypothetical protein
MIENVSCHLISILSFMETKLLLHRGKQYAQIKIQTNKNIYILQYSSQILKQKDKSDFFPDYCVAPITVLSPQKDTNSQFVLMAELNLCFFPHYFMGKKRSFWI